MLGAGFLKVLGCLLQRQMGWKRNGRFQKQHCDLPVLIALLRKSGEALWKQILATALCSFAMDHVNGHWIRVTFYMCVMSHHSNEYIAWALVLENVNWGSEVHSWAHRSVIKPQLGFLKAWQKSKIPFIPLQFMRPLHLSRHWAS